MSFHPGNFYAPANVLGWQRFLSCCSSIISQNPDTGMPAKNNDDLSRTRLDRSTAITRAQTPALLLGLFSAGLALADTGGKTAMGGTPPWMLLALVGGLALLVFYLYSRLAQERRRVADQAGELAQVKSNRDTAVRANQAKNNFLARMSHELRTPLNVILGFAQIQKTQLPPDAPGFMVKNTEETLKAGWQLLNLINDILDITRIEERQMRLSIEDCNLSEVVSHAVSLVQSDAELADISLNIEDSPLAVRADYTRLKQVLVTLFSNSIKYNHAGGDVYFQARELGDGTVECEVRDTGVGIAEEEREAVFEPFTRLKYAESNEIPGTGIGLALARFLAEFMEGSIDFDSVPGEGSSFYLRLPLAGEPTMAQVPAQESPAAPPTQPLTVLYVEDHRASLELMKAIMDPLEHVTLLTATNAEDGIELARQHHPDLVLLDINLLGMDGVTAAREIKQMPELRDIPLVALSADVVESHIEIALEAGFSEYLTKPLDIDELWRLIRDLQDTKQVGER